ncbi:MAG: hypothetical protein IJN82_06375, partial [Clostridia bacterium]|nr:hypothetical protein [Clostridia bacterium]
AQTPQMPDSSGVSDPLANIPKPPAPSAPGPCTPPESDELQENGPEISEEPVTFGKVKLSNYLIVAGYDNEGVKFPSKNLEFIFEDEEIATKLYKILQKTDISQGVVEDESHYFLGDILNPYFHYKAEFTEGATDTVIEFTYSPHTDRIYRKGKVAVKWSDGNAYWLTDDAANEFISLCNANGLTDKNFLINRFNAITSMFEWSFSMTDKEPLVLEDQARQYTPEQAVKILMDELAKELCEPAPNRFFHYENYQGWNVWAISSQSDEYKNNEYYQGMNLAENQYVVSWGEIKGTYVGIGNDGGPNARFVMEYADGQWILYPRERAS